ncbi:MAG: hypothetical protein R2731_02610 [Nocardioides sp.]
MAYAEEWEPLRRHYLERPYDPTLADPPPPRSCATAPRSTSA